MRFGAALLGRAVGGYLQRVATHVEIVAGHQNEERLSAIARVCGFRKVVLCYWIEDMLPLMLARYTRGSMAGIFERVEFIVDDTYGGHLTAAILARLGTQTRCLHWFSQAARAKDVRELIRSTRPIGITADGHGPYGCVDARLARLLRQGKAIAVPLASAQSRSWSFRLRARLSIPRSGSRVGIVLGEAIDASTAEEGLREALENGIGHARTLAKQLVSVGVVSPPERRTGRERGTLG